jgi:hypothetical protein
VQVHDGPANAPIFGGSGAAQVCMCGELQPLPVCSVRFDLVSPPLSTNTNDEERLRSLRMRHQSIPSDEQSPIL